MTSKNPPGWHRGALTHSQQWWRKCQCLCSTTSSMCRTPNDIELGGVHTLPTRQVLSCPAPVCPNSSERFPAQSYMVPSICTAHCALYPQEAVGPEQNSCTCVMRELPQSWQKWQCGGFRVEEDEEFAVQSPPQVSLREISWTVALRRWQSSYPVKSLQNFTNQLKKFCSIVTGSGTDIIKNLLGMAHHYSHY